MGQVTKIAWTNHTFNPWRGCTKVSEGCTYCCAEAGSGRNHKVLGVWGPRGSRVVAAEDYWREPLKWNEQAANAGERRTVFCASLADVFEGYDTMPREARVAVSEARTRLARLIMQTSFLDWLLLTKRPENVQNVRAEIGCDLSRWENQVFDTVWRNRVWLGASVENQASADARMQDLLSGGRDAAVRFASVEPMLGPVDLLKCGNVCGLYGWVYPDGTKIPGLDWVICGGESGGHARPFDVKWARELLKQCQEHGTAFFMKQLGAHTLCCLNERWPDGRAGLTPSGTRWRKKLLAKKGEDPAEWPADLGVREWPNTPMRE